MASKAAWNTLHTDVPILGTQTVLNMSKVRWEEVCEPSTETEAGIA